jgi:hypothetical protein
MILLKQYPDKNGNMVQEQLDTVQIKRLLNIIENWTECDNVLESVIRLRQLLGC